jgi:predicted enzyme related to lactoylglutathione lyase
MYGNKIGDMAWMDLSVPNAEQVKDFYQKVLGWNSEAVKMSCGEEVYADFAMNSVNEYSTTKEESSTNNASDTQFVTGICHAKGANEDMPPVWLPYFLVADIELAVSTVIKEGGELATNIKSMGDDKYVVIKDPAGAQCALYHKAVTP